ncbi:hypothetical protein [Streptomyces sp. 7N604]|uniref:hypothetical protein n=1 Tax=Streptomyces sp. 7N604 TaxID=3457415 RepID=UPI003FD62DD6
MRLWGERSSRPAGGTRGSGDVAAASLDAHPRVGLVTDTVGSLLLVRTSRDSPPGPGDLAELAQVLTQSDTGTATVVVGVGRNEVSSLWARLGEDVPSLRASGARSVRLVMSGAGSGSPDSPAAAYELADAWEMDVLAPDGNVVIVPGGTLFVAGSGDVSRGWRRFTPRGESVFLGPRMPEPSWQRALGALPARTRGRCVVEQIPAGVLVRPLQAPAPGPDDLRDALRVDHLRPTVLVGVPGAPAVPADAVAEVLSALPDALRPKVRLAPGAGVDLLPLGQQVANLLDIEVEVLTGLPMVIEDGSPHRGAPETPVVLVGDDGRLTWQPFVQAVACPPASAAGGRSGPRLLSWHPPMPGWDGAGNGAVRLIGTWQAFVTRAGLSVESVGHERPSLDGRAVDAERMAIELGTPGAPLDVTVLPALALLFDGLGAELLSGAVMYVRGSCDHDVVRELRTLADRHGVALSAPGALAEPASRGKG